MAKLVRTIQVQTLTSRRAAMRVFFISLLMMFGVCASANAACESVPQDVQEYLRSEPGWAFVDVKDLVDDDKSLWEQSHHGLCPGVAIVDLDGKGQQSYALALLKGGSGRAIEKLVVIRRQSGRFMRWVLAPPANVMYTNVMAPFVVWRTSPGTYRDLKSGHQVKLTHHGIVYEKMEATATVYYLSKGRFKSILTSE